jgi:hypothetical protein
MKVSGLSVMFFSHAHSLQCPLDLERNKILPSYPVHIHSLFQCYYTIPLSIFMSLIGIHCFFSLVPNFWSISFYVTPFIYTLFSVPAFYYLYSIPLLFFTFILFFPLSLSHLTGHYSDYYWYAIYHMNICHVH